MNRGEFEGNWNRFKGKIPEKWGKFSREEVLGMEGKYEHFLSAMQKKYGWTREQAEKELRSWHEGTDPKEIHNAWGEETPSDRELAHEDKDPIYPLEPPQPEKKKKPKS